MSYIPLEKEILEEVLKATQEVEKRVDEEIDSLENIEQVRERRLAQLKQQAEKRKEYLALGHGDYREIEERDIFRVLQRSPNVLLHFFTHESEHSKVLDSHLTLLAQKHLECRFVKIDAEKSPYFCGRCHVKVIPTCLIVSNGVLIDRLVGFTELNNTHQFSTELLEAKLIEKNLLTPVEPNENQAKKTVMTFIPKQSRTIQSATSTGSDEEDW
ncbi:hypothetical protein M8J77_025849 [Diaphorina citri]|nr:hypothetical protein M8J77_025849 [Diaphorina citri]